MEMEYRPIQQIKTPDRRKSEIIMRPQGRHKKTKINEISNQSLPVSTTQGERFISRTEVGYCPDSNEMSSDVGLKSEDSDGYVKPVTTTPRRYSIANVKPLKCENVEKMSGGYTYEASVPTLQPGGYYEQCYPFSAHVPSSPVSSTAFSVSSSEADYSSVSGDSLGEQLQGKLQLDQEQRRREREKSLVKSAHISNEHLRLSELLEAMSPDQLMDEIRTRLDKRDSKTIVALSMLLPRKHFPPVDHLHCARCHTKFRPTENTNCILKHPTAKVLKTKQDKHGTDFRCTACTTRFRLNQMFFYNEEVNSYLSGFCYSGKHTTNPKEVSYTSAVKTCEENGCVEIYV